MKRKRYTEKRVRSNLKKELRCDFMCSHRVLRHSSIRLMSQEAIVRVLESGGKPGGVIGSIWEMRQ